MKHPGFGSSETGVSLDRRMEKLLSGGPSRREFLRTLAAVGAGAVFPASGPVLRCATFIRPITGGSARWKRLKARISA